MVHYPCLGTLAVGTLLADVAAPAGMAGRCGEPAHQASLAFVANEPVHMTRKEVKNHDFLVKNHDFSSKRILMGEPECTFFD